MNKPGAELVVFKAERLSVLMNKIFLADSTEGPERLKFISLIRDPRAVYASQLVTLFPGTARRMAEDPVRTALHCHRYIKQIRRYGRSFSNLMVVRYEGLIGGLDECIAEISGFLEIDGSKMDPGKGELASMLSVEEQNIHGLIDRPPLGSRIDAWEKALNLKDVYLIERTCRQGLILFGYERKSGELKLSFEYTRISRVAQLLFRESCLKLKFHLAPYFRRAICKARFLQAYLRSHLAGRIRRNRYGNIRAFLLFAGYPRSGHTLVAALLDAHPDIVLSIEWGVLSHLQMGYRKNAIMYSIEKYSRLFTKRLSNKWTGYSYRIEGQSQGRSDNIELIGDKLAGQTSKILREHPGLLDRLAQEMRMEIRIIHVIRNPYDTISTMAHRTLEKRPDSGTEPELAFFSDRYFERAEIMKSLKDNDLYRIFDLYHEEMIENPRRVLSELLDFLEVGYDESYLKSCSEIIYQSPHQSRLKYPWQEKLIEKVQSEINRFDFLRRYNFHN
jgi:hypothetical protein